MNVKNFLWITQKKIKNHFAAKGGSAAKAEFSKVKTTIQNLKNYKSIRQLADTLILHFCLCSTPLSAESEI